jgi:hypothetical protein
VPPCSWSSSGRPGRGRGRVYLPGEDIARFGYDEERLLRGEADDDFRALLSFEAEHARAARAGRPLGRTIPGRMRWPYACSRLAGLPPSTCPQEIRPLRRPYASGLAAPRSPPANSRPGGGPG